MQLIFSRYILHSRARAFELEERVLIRDGAIDWVNPPRSRSVGFTSSRDIRLESPVLHEKNSIYLHKVNFLCLIFSLLSEDVDNTTNEIFSVSSEEDFVCWVINYNIFLCCEQWKTFSFFGELFIRRAHQSEKVKNISSFRYSDRESDRPKRSLVRQGECDTS